MLLILFIKKHEDTIAYREKTFKTYLQTVGFNAEPVLLTYPDNDVIFNIIKETQKGHAEFEFTMTYRDTHYLWLVQDENLIESIKKEFPLTTITNISKMHDRRVENCNQQPSHTNATRASSSGTAW